MLRAGVVATGLLGGAAVVAETTASAATQPAVGDGFISVLDHGAVGDGVTDDTAAIQSTLDAARTTGACKGVYLPPGRRYKVTDELVASGMTDFVISAVGATLALIGAAASGSGAKSVLHLTNCQRFRVLGLAVYDTDRTQAYNGVRVSRSSGGVLDGVSVRDVRWVGITVFDGTAGLSTDITITGCDVRGTRFGVSTNGTDVRIADNHVAMYWPSTAEAQAKGGVWSTPSDYYDGVMVLTGADRTVVAGNTITECGQAGVYTQNCANLVIADNTVTGCQLRGIEVDGGTGTAVGVSITGNVSTHNVGQINIVRARDVTVVGNRTENPDPARATSCIAINVGSTKAVVVGNHARQAHPTFPAVYVDPAATDVTLAWNSVDAAVAYQAPADTVTIRRSGPGQIHTNAKLIAAGGIGVGNSVPATTPGAVVRKIEVFSATGASLGWIPVYSTIS